MDTIKTLIVDDEFLARQDLKDLLKDQPRIEVIGEADNIATAKELTKEHNPDLIFLDIQFPGETGFDLLPALNNLDPHIIFITAFDEYAIRAFEVNAKDYLLKPVNKDRLYRAINRIERNETQETDIKVLSPQDSIFLKMGNSYRFLKIDTILMIEAADDYTEVHIIGDRSYLTNKSMKEWEYRLPGEIFCRIHRSSIINITKVKKIEPYFNRSYVVYLENLDKQLNMSRRYFQNIKSKLG